MKEVVILICGLDGCLACEKLVSSFQRLIEQTKYVGLNLKVTYDDPTDKFGPFIRPRVYPTVIVIKDQKALLGWEGFATGAPLAVSDATVTEALDLALEKLTNTH